MDSEKSPPPILAVLAPSLFLSVPKYTDQKKLREELAHNSRLQSISSVSSRSLLSYLAQKPQGHAWYKHAKHIKQLLAVSLRRPPVPAFHLDKKKVPFLAISLTALI